MEYIGRYRLSSCKNIIGITTGETKSNEYVIDVQITISSGYIKKRNRAGRSNFAEFAYLSSLVNHLNGDDFAL